MRSWEAVAQLGLFGYTFNFAIVKKKITQLQKLSNVHLSLTFCTSVPWAVSIYDSLSYVGCGAVEEPSPLWLSPWLGEHRPVLPIRSSSHRATEARTKPNCE